MTRRGWLWVGVVLVALGAGPSWGQEPGRRAWPGTWEALGQLKAQVKQLRDGGRAGEAQSLCEQFLTDNPSAGWLTGTAVDEAIACLRAAAPSPAERVEACERVLEVAAGVPWYHAAATFELATGYLWAGHGFTEDFDKALAVTEGKFEQYVDELPADLYLLHFAGLYEARALSRLCRHAEAQARLDSLIARLPLLLAHNDTFSAWYDIALAAGRTAELAGIAKLGYLGADYTTEALKAAIDRCVAALRVAGGGPGPGVLFARCQEDRTLDNPLAQVEPAALPPVAELLAAAGADPHARVAVYLVSGQVTEALALAREQLASGTAGEEEQLARVMRSVARCFKAHDLSLERANAFLEYHRTGEGADPLPGLEAELAAEGGP